MGKENKFSAVHELIDYVNYSNGMTNDVHIAKLFLEYADRLDTLSLADLSEIGYCSQASLSRFIKKMGYPNYDAFKVAISVSLYAIKDMNKADRHIKSMNTDQIKMDVHNSVLNSLSYIEELDNKCLQEIVDSFFEYEQIIFVGSDMSVSIMYLLQLALVARGAEVYCLHDKNFQKEFIRNINKKSLIVAITVEDRWLEFDNFIDVVKEYKDSDQYCFTLWTITNNTEYQNYFDKIIFYGKEMDRNFGYHELMYFSMILYELILKRSA